MSTKFIQELQQETIQFERAKTGKSAANANEIRSKGQSLNLDENLPRYINQDIFYTLIKATKHRIVDPNELLVTGANYTIEEGPNFLKHVGLAIREGASPNIYVSVEDPNGRDTVLHILYYIWTILPKDSVDIQEIYETVEIDDKGQEVSTTVSDVEAYSILEERIDNAMALVAMLAVAGSDITMPVSDPEVLLERRRSQDSKASQVVAFRDAALTNGGILDRKFEYDEEEERTICVENCNLRYTRAPVEELIGNNEDYPELVDLFMETYFYYRKNRLTLDKLLPEDEVVVNIIVNLDLADSLGVIQKTIVEEVDSPTYAADGTLVTEIVEIEKVQERPFPELEDFIDVHAKKSVEKILKMGNAVNPHYGILTVQEAEDDFLRAIDVYNVPVAIALLRTGLKPRYESINRIILRARSKFDEGLPASSAALNRILVEMIERGVGIDEEQLRLVGYFSPSTHDELRRLLKVPFWKRTCSAPGDIIRPDLQKLARELNLPPDMNKQGICEEFEKMDKADPKLLETIAHKLQEKRFDVANTTIGDVVDSNSGTKTKTRSRTRADQAVCVNANLLSRKEYDYADGDLLMVDEGANTYCFEARDYANLIEPEIPINPFTGNKLPESTVGEIQGRLRALERNNLPLDSQGISEAIRQFKEPSAKDKYDEFVRSRVEEFFDLGETYNISRDVYLLSPEEGGLANEEMEAIVRELVDDQGIRFNVDSRQASIRSTAMTVMEKVDDIRSMERMKGESLEDFEAMKQDQMDNLFLTLGDLIAYTPTTRTTTVEEVTTTEQS